MAIAPIRLVVVLVSHFDSAGYGNGLELPAARRRVDCAKYSPAVKQVVDLIEI
jgi:hypothetical protein